MVKKWLYLDRIHRKGDCQFTFLKYYLETISGCLFLGGMGMLSFSISDNIAVTYMLPMLYYILNYGSGKKTLGIFYLFSMSSGSIHEKYYLFAGGVIMIILSILYRRVSFRWR